VEELEAKQLTELAQLVKVLGPALVVFIVLVAAVVIITAVALLSKNGFILGKFRAGVRRTEAQSTCSPVMESHTKLLEGIGKDLKEIKLHLEDQDQMLVGHGAVLGIVLDQFEGKEINGQVEEARAIVDQNKAYHEALKKLLEKKEAVL
jgi:hypothetical protein